MERSLLHVFLNSPIGRENLLQSAYLAEQTKVNLLSVYIPEAPQLALYCDDHVLTVGKETG